jgi:basic membrane lipoprotein Med (substrate-binding protein (PBP1-ABC) superfamily)
MKKLIYGLVIISLLLSACGGEEATDTPEPAPTEAMAPTEVPPTEPPPPTEAPAPTEAPMEEEFRVGMISDVGGVDDASFNQTTWEGLDRADQEIEGVSAQFLESQAQADYENNITEFAEQGYDMIVTVGFLLGDATAKMAEVYPDIKFAIIDFAYDPPIPNVEGIVFNSDEAAFLAGYLAAGMAMELDPEDPQIGWVGGMQIPPVEIFIVGYESGMEYYNQQKGTSVTSSGTYVGNFEAPDEGKTAGNSLLDEGVDIIFGVGGKTGNGGLVAVRERADAGEAVAGIGVDVDQYFTLPTEKGILITSVEKRLDNAVFNAVKDAVEGNFGGGGVYVGTLENDGVGLAPYHDWEDRVPEDLKAEVDALKPQIIAGTLSTGWPVGEEPEAEAVPDLTGETITIYHFGDLSGPYAAITSPLVHGAEDAVAAINAAGGVYGAQFDIKFADTAGSIDEAVAAYDRFTGEDDNPLLMITYGSGEVEALAQRFAEDKIVNLSAGLSARGFYIDSGYTFGLGAIYPDQIGFIMEFLQENWDTYKPDGAGDEIKLAHLSWPSAFGQGSLTEESRAYLADLGIEIVAEEVYDLAPTADTTAAILNAQAAGANVIWTNTLAFGPAAILNDLHALGLRDQFVVAGPNWAMDLATYAFLADPAYGVGLIASFPYLWWTDVDNPGIQYAQQLFEANERPAGEHSVGYLLLVAGVDLFVDALELAIDTVGYENLTGEAVHDALIALGPHEALDGVLRVDFSGGSRSPHMSQIRMIQGGPDAFNVIQDWAEMPDLRPTE